jgi:RimJ/RimL family protein N-acetyltransferase
VIRIEGRRLVLRGFRADELDALHEAYRRSEAMVGEPDREQVQRRIAGSGEWADGRLDLAVDAGGELIGSVDARSGRMMLPPGVCEFGIELWAERRGGGLGTEVVETLTAWLHEHGFPRVQAGTDLRNTPMRRVLEKAGYANEGTMRGFMPDQDDRRADYALYAHVVVRRAPHP